MGKISLPMRALCLLLFLANVPLVSAQHAARDSVETRLAALEERLSEPRIRFSGEFFGAYGYKTTNTGSVENENRFSVDRWFFTAQARLSDRVRFRGTTDIRPARADAAHGHSIVLAYAHADWNVAPGLTLRGGMIPGGWVNYLSGVWGYRGVARVLADEEKHLSLGVIGAGALYGLPGKRGEVGLLVHNGQTRSPERDAGKEVSLYGHVRPFAETPVTVGAHASAEHDGTQRWGAVAAYGTPRARIGINYERQRDDDTAGQGIGVFATVPLVRGEAGALSLVGLADVYDPDSDVARDQRLRTVVGLAFAPTSGFDLVLDYQQYHAASDQFDRPDGGLAATDGTLYLHAIIRY